LRIAYVMTRKVWKRQPSAEKVPEEVESFIYSIFLELEMGAESIEEAVLSVARSDRRRVTGVVKQYMRQVEAHEHDPTHLDLVLKRAARRGGYIVEGDARGFLLEVRKTLKLSVKPSAGPHHKQRKA
jgi:hypothetical protein